MRFLCPVFYLCLFHLLRWFNFSQHGHVTTYPVKCGIKLLIHSQTSVVALLKFENGLLFHHIPYTGCTYLSMLGLNLIHVSKRAPGMVALWSCHENEQFDSGWLSNWAAIARLACHYLLPNVLVSYNRQLLVLPSVAG